MNSYAYLALKTWDIVTIAADFEDAEVAGLTGHICSAIEPSSVGVFVYGVERVWCIEPWHLSPTGKALPEADRPGARLSIRVNQNGEIVI